MAVPSIERMPLTVTPVVVFARLPDKVRLLYMTGATVWAPALFHSTVPVPAVNVPTAPLTDPPIFKVLEPPLRVPLVLVHVPVNVCVNPVPRFRVPPLPLIVRPAPLTLPAKVAVPAVLVMETVPVVVNPSMLCVAAVPLIVIGDTLAVKVPSLTKLPPRDKDLLLAAFVFKVAPAIIVSGTYTLKTLLALIVIIPILSMITPPVAANGVSHSAPAVRAVGVL